MGIGRRDFASSSNSVFAHRAAHSDEIAYVKVAHEAVFIFADLVRLEIHLDPAAAVLDVGKRCLAHGSERYGASGYGYHLSFQIIRGVQNLPSAMSALVAFDRKRIET